MPTPPDLPDLPLDDYLRGALDPDAAEAVRTYLEATPERRGFMAGVRAATRGDDLGISSRDPEARLAQLLARIEHQTASVSMPSARRKSVSPFRAWRAASAIALAGIAAASLWSVRDRVWPSNNHTTTARADVMRARTYAAAAGQQATVTLPDGSAVTLGPASTLRYAEQADGARNITLQGQAMFLVTASQATPFTVQTAQSITRVLGTTFVVRDYPTDARARVTVASGRVSVQAPRHAGVAVLAANAMALVGDSGAIVTNNIAVNDYTAWTTGLLVFTDTPLRELVADLGRAYDVDITLADSALSARPMTWRIQTHRHPLARALRELTTLLGAHIEQSGHRVTIVPGTRAETSHPSTSTSTSSETKHGR